MQDSVGFFAPNISFNHHIIHGGPMCLAHTVPTERIIGVRGHLIEGMGMC